MQHSNYSTSQNRRSTSHNLQVPVPNYNSIQHQRKSNNSRTGLRNLNTDLEKISSFDNHIHNSSFTGVGALSMNMNSFSNEPPSTAVKDLDGISATYDSFNNQINESIHDNSYINNSSVSKSAVHRRRNVPIANDKNLKQFDRSSLDTAHNLNGIARPTINNTYNGQNIAKTSNNMNKIQNPKMINNMQRIRSNGMKHNSRPLSPERGETYYIEDLIQSIKNND